MNNFTTKKRRTSAIEVQNKVACLPGYETYTLGKEKYMLNAKFIKKSSNELRQEQSKNILVIRF